MLPCPCTPVISSKMEHLQRQLALMLVLNEILLILRLFLHIAWWAILQCILGLRNGRQRFDSVVGDFICRSTLSKIAACLAL